MSKTSESVQIDIPMDLIEEIEAIKGRTDLENFICRAIRNYICAIRRRERPDEIVDECAGSANEYDELSPDLADEVWLYLEKDALRLTGRYSNDSFSEN